MKWEYSWKESVDKDDRENVANIMGGQEWELVQEVQESNGNFCTLIFRREQQRVAPTRRGPLGSAFDFYERNDP